MKKCIFILPYFGKFNNYFPLFLKSCKENKDFDWLIFTDDREQYAYPSNVHVHYMSFEEIREFIQKKFDFSISLERPYKLCDYKVAYGYIFSEYIQEYYFWGFCDCDMIMGNLSKFITEERMKKYKKIFTMGHMTLFQNDYKNNVVFKLPYHGNEYYKIVFSSAKSFAFDEHVINRIYEENKIPMLTEDCSANVSVYKYKFCLVKRIYDICRYVTEDYIPAIYVWENGAIKRYFFNEDFGVFVCNEFAYIHLQQRNMKLDSAALNAKSFQIVPNKFIPCSVVCTEQNYSSLKRKVFDIKGMRKCLANNLRWGIKRRLSYIQPKIYKRLNTDVE